MTPDELYNNFVAGFRGRKFSAGLLVAFIDFLIDLRVPGSGANSFNDVLARHPRQTELPGGRRANTLVVEKTPGNNSSIRPFYDAAERYFRAEKKRFDYPSCAPHATQAWADYTNWLDALSGFSLAELEALKERVKDYVLTTLKSQEFEPGSIKIDPPLFRYVLEDFDLTSRKGETSGAAYQGVVFGFIRADNPHLQVEIDKVRTGSKRLQRVGDIDCWEGARLAISSEVKQYIYPLDGVPDLEAFANEVGRRGALGIVATLGFEEGVRDAIEELGVKALDRDDLLKIVELWDPLKQRTAVASLMYYVQHVEKNSSLTERLKEFLEAKSDRTEVET